jgi:membrane-bound inhibitor of C-type lysozyme
MRPKPSLAAALLAASTAAHADPLTLQLPGGAAAERNTVAYSCDGGRSVKAEYINAGANSLAIVHRDGQAIVMVSVLSGSGARYAGQQYIWWTKGNAADFYDLTRGEDAPAEFSCTAG